jgi:predicted RNase H-like HicB family nuclease
MTGYAIVIEGKGDSFSAYAPELPGCIVTGKSVAAVENLMREAIEFHLEGMKIDGNPIPPPTTVATSIAEVTLGPWSRSSSYVPSSSCRRS